jgi:hypothetical protein
VSIAKHAQRVHVARMAVQVDRHDRLRPGSELALDVSRVDLPGGSVGVGEHWCGSGAGDRVRRSDIREDRNDHLVAWPDAEGEHRQVQRHRAVAHGRCVRCTDPLRELPFEAGDEVPLRRDPRRIQALGDVVFLVTRQVGSVHGNAYLGHVYVRRRSAPRAVDSGFSQHGCVGDLRKSQSIRRYSFYRIVVGSLQMRSGDASESGPCIGWAQRAQGIRRVRSGGLRERVREKNLWASFGSGSRPST